MLRHGQMRAANELGPCRGNHENRFGTGRSQVVDHPDEHRVGPVHVLDCQDDRLLSRHGAQVPAPSLGDGFALFVSGDRLERCVRFKARAMQDRDGGEIGIIWAQERREPLANLLWARRWYVRLDQLTERRIEPLLAGRTASDLQDATRCFLTAGKKLLDEA